MEFVMRWLVGQGLEVADLGVVGAGAATLAVGKGFIFLGEIILVILSLKRKRMEKTKCPYCRANIEVIAPSVKDHGAELNLCPNCHKPIAVYSCRATSMQHSDRSVKAVVVTPSIDQEADPWLEIVENQFTIPQDYSIPMGTSILGRQNKDSAADIQVFSADPSMSRNHIKIVRRKEVISVMDNESNTGTFVNGRLLARGEQVHLRDGDVLSLGALSVIVHLPSLVEEEEFDLADFDL